MKQSKILMIAIIVLAIGTIALTAYKKMNKQEDQFKFNDGKNER